MSPISPLEMEALVASNNNNNHDAKSPPNSNNNNATATPNSASSSSSSPPTSIWQRWKRLVIIILVACFIVLLWDRIEIESTEDGNVVVKMKLPKLRGKVLVSGSSGPPITKPPRPHY